MTSYERFQAELKVAFHPLLRSHGFKGSGSTSRRVCGEMVWVVNVQGSMHGGRCCVNLGVHFSFLLEPRGTTLDPATIKEHQCAFRDRVRKLEASDQWWDYGDDAEATCRAVANLVATFKEHGMAFFRRFEPYPEVFDGITPAQVEQAEVVSPLRKTRLDAALFMAQLRHHQGRAKEGRLFAEVGLRHLGGATGLRGLFEILAAS